ncbi:hypothetical protein [Shinella sp. JR1-6]|uniref:hypothetical protein n=1 Tax=Shinella sp. JR1-6 TaxID=2527671 RepID=UPI00102D53F8|nr:hypothetical protein [Shinella sp. JR1-6]TAA61624.1 hypothetical protein EXZ48_10765 [Shinella sp. JR1-6]
MSKKIKYVEVRVATIDHRKYAVVPLREYEEYVTATLLRKTHKRPRPSFIDERPTVAAFFAENINTKSAATLITECSGRFGAENTPTLAVVYRYWKRLSERAACSRPSEFGLTARLIVCFRFCVTILIKTSGFSSR